MNDPRPNYDPKDELDRVLFRIEEGMANITRRIQTFEGGSVDFHNQITLSLENLLAIARNFESDSLLNYAKNGVGLDSRQVKG